MYYNNRYQMSPKSISKLLKLVLDIVRFEANTELTFDYLKVIAPSKEESEFLHSMLNDEREHINEFKKFFYSLTNQEPMGQPPTFERPISYATGVKDLFNRKLEIIATYKKIKQISPYVDLREKLVDYIQDEVRHLTMLNHILLINNQEERIVDFQMVSSQFPTKYSN